MAKNSVENCSLENSEPNKSVLKDTVAIRITSKAVIGESRNCILFHDLVVVFAAGVRDRCSPFLESVTSKPKEEFVL